MPWYLALLPSTRPPPVVTFPPDACYAALCAYNSAREVDNSSNGDDSRGRKGAGDTVGGISMTYHGNNNSSGSGLMSPGTTSAESLHLPGGSSSPTSRRPLWENNNHNTTINGNCAFVEEGRTVGGAEPQMESWDKCV